MPSPSLLIHNAPPQLYFPSTPTRMAIIAEEHSLNLKISMSLSLCSCRGTSPKAAPRYGWPCLFASSGGPFTHSQHTPQNNTHTHSLKDTQKQLSLLFCSFVITVIPHQANLASARSCGFTAVRMEHRNPAAIKCRLLLPNSLLRTDHSGTIYFICYLRRNTHQGTAGSAHTKPLQ